MRINYDGLRARMLELQRGVENGQADAHTASLAIIQTLRALAGGLGDIDKRLAKAEKKRRAEERIGPMDMGNTFPTDFRRGV